MNDTDLSDNAATQFLLTTDAGNEKIDAGRRAFASVIGLRMWREAVRRCEMFERIAYFEAWSDGANRGLRGYPEEVEEGYRKFKEWSDEERSKTAL